MKRLPLHVQIIIGLTLGVVWGFFSNTLEIPTSFTANYIKPFGTIFIRLLKMIAVPLVFSSLISGVSKLNDVNKLSRMGGKTISIYIGTTILALTIGLVLVNIVSPGDVISDATRAEIMLANTDAVSAKLETTRIETSPLAPLVNMVPTNVFSAAGNNSAMLQIVFLAILIGIACIKLPKEKSEPFVKFFESLDHITIKLIDYIMLVAPIGVFALIAALIVEMQNPEILYALMNYSLTVIAGLLIMMLLGYPLLLKLMTNQPYFNFFKKMRPALLLAFSTSSSSATLPVTMKQCEEELNVKNEVTSFVLPLGATINMDGTSLYQAVAAVFIAQVVGIPLSLGDQLTIVFTALLASIGTAGVPGAGMIMLAIILESVGIPVAYIALILAPDRILDMCRTTVNVTGDATVACIINEKEKAFSEN